MFYTVYQITNTINGKIYVGMHATDDLDDGYLGSGNLIKRAVAKYGIESFAKDYIAIFDTRDDMVARERLIVNEDFVSRNDTYNIKIGGQGGWDHIKISAWIGRSHSVETRLLKSKQTTAHWQSLTEEQREAHRMRASNYAKNRERGSFTGKKHSAEARQKQGEKGKERVGEKNPSYGSKWIFSRLEERSQKVPADVAAELVEQGWEYGRVIDFNPKLKPDKKVRPPKALKIKVPPKPMSERNLVRKVSDEDYIAALRSTPNICQALIKLGLAPRGKNYERAKRLRTQFGLDVS